ncbi:MAG TPA: HEAT repeat domain-containing protein [Thermoanaerobaculia bacterium]|nr:HEAT repeat domain-containing protein [Thermoanaerobaculia bacterium]
MRAIELAVAWLGTYALHSTLLLGLAWALTRWGVRSHAAREAIWKAALAGGILTASVQLAVGFEPLLGRLNVAGERAAQTTTSSARADGIDRVSNAVPNEANLARDERGEKAKAPDLRSPGKESESAAATTPAPTTRSRVLTALIGAWGLAALLLAVRFLVSHALFLLRVGPRALVRDEQLVELVDLLREEAGMRGHVRLTRAAGLPSPIALGRAEICLPDAALAELDREQQESMLAHEVAHLARRDPAWLAIAGVVERLLFFQPLNRLARRRIQESAEYLCDDWAARRTGSGMTLAKCLVKVAEWIDAAPEAVPLSGMAEERSQFVSRIDRLVANRALSTRPAGRWVIPAAAAVVLAAAVAAPGVTATDYPWPEPFLLAHAWSASEDSAGGSGSAGLSAQTSPESPSGPAAASALIGALRDDDAGVRAAAAEALRKRGETAAVPALVAALSDEEAAVRANAVEALGELGDGRALDGLLTALGDANAEVRARAASALGELHDAHGRTADAQRMARALAGLLGDGSVEVRKNAVHALSQLETARPIEAMLAATKDVDAEVRQQAVHSLGEFEAREAAPQLVALLGDPDAEVRHAAAHALGELQHTAAAPQLARLLTDRDPDVRQAAAQSLGELGLHQAPPELLAALRDGNADVRQSAVHTVAEMQDARAVPALVALLDDPSGDVREAAVDALSEIRDAAAIDALVRAMKSNDPNVRRHAADALGERD